MRIKEQHSASLRILPFPQREEIRKNDSRQLSPRGALGTQRR